MHLPELALHPGRLSRLSSQLCLRVDVGERQVPEHEAELTVLADQLPHDGLGLTAEGALEVPVLNQGDEGVLVRAADVIAVRVDRDDEVGNRLLPPVQQQDAPPRR
jgi:hypothetical protein